MKTLLLAYEMIKGRALANNSPNSTPKLNRKHSESRHLLFFFFSDSVHSCFCCLSGIWISFSRTRNLYSHSRNAELFGGHAQKNGQLSCGVTLWLVSRESIMASWKLLEKVVNTSKASIPLASFIEHLLYDGIWSMERLGNHALPEEVHRLAGLQVAH